MAGKREYKIYGWAWYTKNKGALQIGMSNGKGQIDRDLMFVIFAGDLEKVKEGTMRSARIYKHTPLQRNDARAKVRSVLNCPFDGFPCDSPVPRGYTACPECPRNKEYVA